MPKRILVVENEAVPLEIALGKLRTAGYEADGAADVTEAERMLATQYDLVLVDGDLGDGKYGVNGLSGAFVTSHLTGRFRYGRLSGNRDFFPNDPALLGEIVIDKPFVDLVEKVEGLIGTP